MNRFKDEQGHTWLVTSQMAKHLGMTAGGLSCYKLDGTLKRGIHWIQQTTGHRRVFYRKDLILEWYFGKPEKTKESKTEDQAPNPKKDQKATRTFSIYLQEDVHEKLTCIQHATSLTIKKEIDGVVLQETQEEPKLNTVVNMLLAKAINEYFETNAS